jgi:hypothetical protein
MSEILPLDCCNCQDPIQDLKCDTCQRFFCKDCWSEANDENCHWESDHNGLYHLTNCDECEYGDHGSQTTPDNYYLLHQTQNDKEGRQEYYVRRDSEGKYYSFYVYWENNPSGVNIPIYNIS